jgi:pilus assembly protein CpaE
MKAKEPDITALLIAPDRELARQFHLSAERSRAFQVISEMKTYPQQQTLEIRLRQFNPDVVLLDVASDLEAACDIIRVITTSSHPAHVVGLHARNDSDAILRSLRMGATEFLYAPFDAGTQREAVARLQRILRPQPSAETEPGSVVVFSSAKPGSGASTLAAQTAFAVRRATGKRTLLADFDVMGGMIGFYLKLNHNRSALDALQMADQLNDSTWPALVTSCEGVDILPAPETPFTGPIDSNRLHTVFEYARLNYEWIFVDVPVVFQRLSLMAISESDRAFLVSTSELPSLHLARKAVNLLHQLGFPKERFQIMVNRINKRDEIAVSDIEKLFNCTVHSRFPNDYFSLHRAVTLGQPVEGHSELGKAFETLAGRLAAIATGKGKKNGLSADSKAALSFA